MSSDFDAYHRWLGIPPNQQPANHYRLLGIELYEADANVIDEAASRQMSYVRAHALGPHVAASQKILNELSAARICLLNPEKKAAYDCSLRNSLLQTPDKLDWLDPASADARFGTLERIVAGTSPVGPGSQPDPAQVSRRSVVSTVRLRGRGGILVASGVAFGLILLIALAAWSLSGSAPVEPVAAAGKAPRAPSPAMASQSVTTVQSTAPEIGKAAITTTGNTERETLPTSTVASPRTSAPNAAPAADVAKVEPPIARAVEVTSDSTVKPPLQPREDFVEPAPPKTVPQSPSLAPPSPVWTIKLQGDKSLASNMLTLNVKETWDRVFFARRSAVALVQEDNYQLAAECEPASKRLDGLLTVVFPSGQPKLHASYQDNKREGQLIAWNDDGQVLYFEKSKNDKVYDMCCLFKGNRPWLIEDYDRFSRVAIHRIENNQIARTYHDEQEAIDDPSVLEALAALKDVRSRVEQEEIAFKRNVRDYVDDVRRQLSAQKSAMGREAMLSAMQQRNAANQAAMNAYSNRGRRGMLP